MDDKLQFFLLVKGEVTENELVLEYDGPDGKTHQQTVTERNIKFPVFEECRVQVLGFNPQVLEEQLWKVEGPREKVVPLLDKVQPLTPTQAKDLNWGPVPLSELPVFIPPENQ